MGRGWKMSAGDSRERLARVHGSAGEQPRLRGLMRVVLPLMAAVGLAGYVLGAAVQWPRLGAGTAGALLLALAAGLAVAVRVSRSRLAAFIKGARGEEAAARVLGLLPETYDVFHGLAAGTGGAAADVDHVVVGPHGVFAVETKNWAGRIDIADGQVMYNGRRPDRPPVEQVGRAADALRAALRAEVGEAVPVQPILCFVDDGSVTHAGGVSGVLVCGARHLRDTILEHTENALSAPLRARVVAALRQKLD